MFIIVSDMIEGIIYKYTSPSGKSYIGQTTNELYRRRMWFSMGRYTGGRSKIDRARKKYGPENFKYEILLKNTYFNIEEAISDLNKWEIYYIGYYNTYTSGYNCTLGGEGSIGYKHSEEVLYKISKALKGKKKSKDFGIKVSERLKGKPKSMEIKKKLSESKKNKGNKIIQYNLLGEYIKTWNNIDEVSKALKVSRESIAGCCRGKSKTAHRFIWRYGNDSASVHKVKRRKDAKPVLKILNGIIIKEYESVTDAALDVKAFESNIAACCRGKYKSVKGYNWKYKEDYI